MMGLNWQRITVAASTVLLMVGCSSEGGDTDAAQAVAKQGAAATAMTAGLIDPNAASQAALSSIPGLSSEVVSDLLAKRPFADMGTFDTWIGSRLDDTAREALYRVVFIPIDLNHASREEILLIPGVGPRMAHEFEEYRPYESMDQFRREIGKYVDDDEVARLERYVRIGEE